MNLIVNTLAPMTSNPILTLALLSMTVFHHFFLFYMATIAAVIRWILSTVGVSLAAALVPTHGKQLEESFWESLMMDAVSTCVMMRGG